MPRFSWSRQPGAAEALPRDSVISEPTWAEVPWGPHPHGRVGLGWYEGPGPSAQGSPGIQSGCLREAARPDSLQHPGLAVRCRVGHGSAAALPEWIEALWRAIILLGAGDSARSSFLGFSLNELAGKRFEFGLSPFLLISISWEGVKSLMAPRPPCGLKDRCLRSGTLLLGEPIRTPTLPSQPGGEVWASQELPLWPPE